MIVQTQAGRICGVQEGNLCVFRGIPYALPPTGERRFAPPAPLPGWEGVLEADHFGPAAHQPESPLCKWEDQSEDCLRLNIWTPGVDKQRRPVLVDIHGGGFTTGTGAHFGGFTFAERDQVVCVSINYRLGALGFLYLGELLGSAYHTSGNNGLLDIVAALRWVRGNIEHFGGDPTRITVSGGSAGAKCASTLLAIPAAEGLFHQVIAQSGAMQTVRDPHTAHQVTLRLLDRLGIPHSEAERLLSLPAQTIIEAQENHLHAFGPVRDGFTIRQEPLGRLLSARRHKTPILIGTNLDEAQFFLSPDREIPEQAVVDSLFGRNADAFWSLYHRAAAGKSVEAAWKDTLTECLYHTGAVRLAEEASQQGYPVWLYRFGFSNGVGAVHGFESGFVTNHPPEHSTVPPEGKPLAASMHAAWAAFLHSGQPETEWLPKWPSFTAAERSVMVLNENCTVEREPELPEPPLPEPLFQL
ncbi:carboxylesterase family protein [Gorillibacterium sp. CAU 1737]|uniref:carboxylesterase/lipase family protein n=1 Tax=Gorillibacterium sp. CAU 1737 TaxID=3140362 RepID=UPI003260A9AE